MAIVAGDLIAYQSDLMVEDDTTANPGGAIATTDKRVIDFTNEPINTTVEALSSDSGDTARSVTVRGRNTAGAIVTDVIAMDATNATTVKQDPSSPNNFERILQVTMDAAASGVITVRHVSDAGDIIAIPIGCLDNKRFFISAQSDPGGSKIRFEKFFWKNTHASLDLLDAVITLTDDGTTNTIEMALATIVDDTVVATNRLTAPTPVGTFVSTGLAQTVPDGPDLAFGKKVGVWIKQTLGLGQAAFNEEFTTEISGTTV
jgi:hypothetical protein